MSSNQSISPSINRHFVIVGGGNSGVELAGESLTMEGLLYAYRSKRIFPLHMFVGALRCLVYVSGR